MHHSVEGNDSSPENEREDIASDALGAAESYVAGSADAGRACDGSGEAFSSTFGAFVSWGDASGLIRSEDDFTFFKRPPDGYGDEHQAWFDEPQGIWFKATYHNRFGLAWGRDGTATVREYLTRLLLQNIYFGDDIQLVALVNCGEKLRVLISQPHVAGEPATYDEIQRWFRFLGFSRIETGGSIAWYLPTENLLVADAHEGNVIRIRTGKDASFLVPIDLNIVQPNGSMLDWIVGEIGEAAFQ
jgi:hypothetical protein